MKLDEQLPMMPLHAISNDYGETGLVERFDFELVRFAPAQQVKMRQARDLALHLHRNNTRWRGTYGEHLLRVAIRIMAPTHYGVSDHNLVIAGLLHDSVEDHAPELAALAEAPDSCDGQAIALNLLGSRFGEEVKVVVKAVTNPEFDMGKDWRLEYLEHVKENMLKVPAARVLKASDFTDNGAGILYSDPTRQAHFAAKYKPLIPVFRELIPLPDTPISMDAKDLILEQLMRSEKRFAEILD